MKKKCKRKCGKKKVRKIKLSRKKTRKFSSGLGEDRFGSFNSIWINK